MGKYIINIVSVISAICISVTFAPFISFWFAYLGGWICSLVVGNELVEGLNLLFNTTHFTKDMIPLCAATLGWIGGYFKANRTNVSDDK